MNDWLTKIATPMADSPCGEDPGYADGFVIIKNEINKLQGTDYPLVQKLSSKILSETSKDLRVAGYFILAATYNEGVSGLRQGVGAYRILLENYWQDCHPRRPRAREAALRWLNTDKLDLFARKHSELAEEKDYLQIKEDIAAINSHSAGMEGDEPPVWNVLDSWLNNQLAKKQEASATESIKTKGAANKGLSQSKNAGQGHEQVLLTSGTLTSDKELQQATRAIREFLLEKKEYLQAMAYSRALRWGAITVPPNDNGQTRVPHMREIGMQGLENAKANQGPEEIFIIAENLFLEPGGQFNFDLQYEASQAATAMARPDLDQAIIDQCLTLTGRHPELLGLKYENGTPFANPQTRQWLEEMQAARTGGSPVSPADDWQTGLNIMLAEAQKLAKKKNLPQALALIQNFPAANEKHQLVKKLAMSSLCSKSGRHDMALPVLEELAELAKRQSLQVWDANLATEIWIQFLDATRSLLKKASGDDKNHLQTLEQEAKSFLCKVDLATAAKMI